jgi:hypothetical protein
MALKSLVSKLSEKLADTLAGKPERGLWQPASGAFPRLMLLDAEVLKDRGGLFALWHRGVRPQWIYIGCATDLASAIKASQCDPDVALYDLNDGVYVAWAQCKPEERIGAVVHLRQLLSPAITRSPLEQFGTIPEEAEPIEFQPPVD